MVLVDTSVWVSHLRDGDAHLEKLLLDAEVACHEFVIGELACGTMKNRNGILSLIQALPMLSTVEFREYLYFIDQHKLMGKGIGFVDVHLLASAQLAKIPLWTADKRLRASAKEIGLQYEM